MTTTNFNTLFLAGLVLLGTQFVTENTFAKNKMKPEEINAQFADAFNSGKIENILRLYEKDAVIHSSDTKVDRGLKEIALALKPLLAMGGRMQATNVFVSQSGNTALLRAEWKLIGAKKEDGSPLEIGGTSIEVVRKQTDGTWLYVIDNPFGGRG